MLRRIIVSVVGLLAMLQVSADVKLGYVDVRQVYDAMPEMENVKQQFEATSLQYQKELENMRSEFQKKYTEYQALNSEPSTSAAIKERRVQELQTLDRGIQDFMTNATTQLNNYEQQLLQPVIDLVVDAVRQIGTEGGFTMIYGDLSPQSISQTHSLGLEPIFMSPDVVDITPLVLQKLGLQ